MKHYCIISHTHWDREWYQTQEEFRLRLIDLFDHLLEILEQDSEYVFHMDAQTIVFEDYWEVKPEMKEKCYRYIREGRLLAGPWYVQNDFFLTSGESTVRNLLLGSKMANEMGYCARTGYAPDQFGLISQLPQIFQGFGINHCVFGRGYTSYIELEDGSLQQRHKPAEFVWKSPDGSEILGIYMTYFYNNAQRFSANIDKAVRLVEKAKNAFHRAATTPYLLLMNGVDHLEPQPDLLPILKEVQKHLPEDEKIYQTTLEQYAQFVREAKPWEDFPVECGELMQGPNAGGTLKDTTSSRPYLKMKNCEIQNMLENCLEPLYSFLELRGIRDVYPAGQLDYLWKMLIRNHAHDSICGCSRDAVHRHMEDRFAVICEMGKELQRRGLQQLAAHVQAGYVDEDYQIVVFNPLEQARTEVVEVTMDILKSDNPKQLQITDCHGVPVPFHILEENDFVKSIFSPVNLPGRMDTVRYKVRMLAEHIPAFGYAVYRVETDTDKLQCVVSQPIAFEEEGMYKLVNDALEIRVSPIGKIDMLHKGSGHWYQDVLTVQDTADIGNAYVFKPVEGDVPIDVHDYVPQITLEETDDFIGKICLHYELSLPACYDIAERRRSRTVVTQPLDIFLCLKRESKNLEITFVMQNHAKDHRMNAMIRTGLESDISMATTPYDIISHNKWDNDKRVTNETEHNSGMVLIAQDDISMAVFNRGIYGYEHLQREQGTLTFPIVRATGTIAGGVDYDDTAWRVPENQCLRLLQSEIALMPQKGTNCVPCAVFEAKAFQNPLITQCEPVEAKKFLGGRPAVQDTSIAELFYQKIPSEEVKLDVSESAFQLTGDGILVTAWKKAYNRNGYILRFYNANEYSTQAVLQLGTCSIHKVYMTNLAEITREEIELNERQIHIPVQPKQIITLLLEQ